MLPWRFQLAAYSPLTLIALSKGMRAELGLAEDSVDRLQRILTEHFRAETVRLYGSGTQALTVALTIASRVSGSDIVALPAYCCYDLASAVIAADVRPTFYDLDATSLSPDPASVERSLSAGAGTVVVAPLYGVPVDWDRCAGLIRSHGALALEDAAQGQGASWRGRPLGSLGDMSVLSFGRGKGWTGGAGGALLGRGTIAAAVASVPQGGRHRRTEVLAAAAQWLLGRPSLYAVPRLIPGLGLGETRYREPVAPHGLTSGAAAVLAENWAAVQREAATRRDNADYYSQHLKGRGISVTAPPAHGEPGYLRFPVLVPGGLQALGARRAVRRGIAPGYPQILPSLKPLQGQTVGPMPPLSAAERLARDLVTLPTHSLVTKRDRLEVLQICNALA